jgi:hypothetical protein
MDGLAVWGGVWRTLRTLTVVPVLSHVVRQIHKERVIAVQYVQIMVLCAVTRSSAINSGCGQ